MNALIPRQDIYKILFQYGRGFFIYILILLTPVLLRGQVSTVAEASRQLNADDPFYSTLSGHSLQLAVRAKSSTSDAAWIPYGVLTLPLTEIYHLDAGIGYISRNGSALSYFLVGAGMHQALNDSSLYSYSVSVQKRYLTTFDERLRRISMAVALDRRIGNGQIGGGVELNLEKGSVNGYSPDGWIWMPYMIVTRKNLEAIIRSDGADVSFILSAGINL